jgi:uncharacterized membrane protein YsdA (DUF1294 family)
MHLVVPCNLPNRFDPHQGFQSHFGLEGAGIPFPFSFTHSSAVLSCPAEPEKSNLATGPNFGVHFWLDVGSSGFGVRQIHNPTEALHVLLRGCLRGMYLYALWNRAWGVHDSGPQSAEREGVVCRKARFIEGFTPPSIIEMTTLHQVLFGWLALTSCVTFMLFGYDKLKAGKLGQRRVSEFHLALLGAVGGWPGGLMGMLVFRHKTVKLSFQLKYALAFLVRTGFMYVAFGLH